GLAEETGGAALLCGLCRALVDLAAEHDHGNRAVTLLDALQHPPAVDARHHHVEQDELRRLLTLHHAHSLLGSAGLQHWVAAGRGDRAHVLAHALGVVDDEHRRPRSLASARARALEELVEVGAAITAVAAGCVEGGDAALVGPLANRALGDAEVLRGLPEGQPVGLGGGCSASWEVAVAHSG